MVREDREDRDVKQFNQENGIAPPPSTFRGRARGRGRAPGRGPPREFVPRVPTGESSGTQVVVHGLPWSFTWKELRPMFEGYGTIVRADIAYGRDGRSRGYGTVQFETPEEALRAIDQVNGTELEGRTLSVKVDQFA